MKPSEIVPGGVYLKKRGATSWPRRVMAIHAGWVTYVDPWGWRQCSRPTFAHWALRALTDAADWAAHADDLLAIARLAEAGPGFEVGPEQ
jgi:hypothetical protein